jgi:pimeloyl-ACP methyl ester carboxylesterase
MAWWCWGDPKASHAVVCVHGLTRQGRDFDFLARTLVERSQGALRVIAPDVVGRGRSDWLPDAALYQLPQYVGDMLTLLQHLNRLAPLKTLDWVGTSMGGLVGMALAGQPQLSNVAKVRRLVLNDVGPSVQWSSIVRMQAYVGRYGTFGDLQEAARYLRTLSAGFGPVPWPVWLALSQAMLRTDPQGRLTLHYDPAIGEAIAAMTPDGAKAAEATLWGLYEAITAEILLLRGTESDVLGVETARAMTERGPRARLVQWEGVGHAPTLTDPLQMSVVADFLCLPH